MTWRNVSLPLNVTVMVDDWPISMEVDTVAALTLVSESSSGI